MVMKKMLKNKDIENYEESLKKGIEKGELVVSSSLEELQKLKEIKKGDFLIILAHATFKWEEVGKRKKVTIELPSLDFAKKKYIAAFDKDGRKLLEGRDLDYSSFNIPWERKAKKFLLMKENKLQLLCRWAAGGAIPILKFKNGDRYVALIRRGKEAPTHQYHFTTASGLSEYPEELIDPRIIMGREFGEEIIIINKSGIIYKYRFKLSRSEKRDEKVENLIQRYYEEEYKGKIESFKNELKENYGIKKIDEEKYVEAEIISLGEDIIEINLNENKKSIKGACVLDPIFGAVDVIGAVEVELDVEEPSEIQVLNFDTREKKPSKGKYEFLNENIFLIKMDYNEEGLRNLIEGEKFRCIVFHKQLKREKPLLTPPLRATLVSCYNYYFPSDKISDYGYPHSKGIPVRGVE
jgi:hypothetical protein